MREGTLFPYVENDGFNPLSYVFHIRMLFFLDLKEINHSYTKYEVKVYKLFPSVRRTGKRFVFDLLIYPDGSKVS